MNSGNEKIIADYLRRHETAIALGLNDFADLRSVFIEVFNRKPENALKDEDRPRRSFFGLNQ